jgi:hypothetical protein
MITIVVSDSAVCACEDFLVHYDLMGSGDKVCRFKGCTNMTKDTD